MCNTKVVSKVYEFMKAHDMPTADENIIIGFSGGADSVCLLFILDLLKKEVPESASLNLYAVHVNHGIRGEEAKRDENFVRDFCKEKGIDLTVAERDIPAIVHEEGLSEEAAGRRERYKMFREKAAGLGGAVIATAHHKNDSAETVLFNMARGTGLSGITGITPKNGDIIRPLMCLTRAEIEDFVNENDLEYVTDSTNADTDYTRNFIRHKIIEPMEREVNSGFVEHVSNLSEIASEYKAYVDAQAGKVIEKAEAEEDMVRFVRQDLRELPDVVLKTLIAEVYRKISPEGLDISSERIKAVADKIKESLPEKKMIEMQKGVAVRLSEKEAVFTCENAGPSEAQDLPEPLFFMDDAIREKLDSGKSVEIFYDKYKVHMELTEIFMKNPDSDYTKYFNYDKIVPNVCMRVRRPKDVIIIDRQGSKKKLKKEFIDRKIPEESRAGCLIFADGDRCLWAVGVRQSADTFADKDSTVLKITVEETEKDIHE